MRIPIDLLPPIKSLPGRFRKMDCFVCCWCVFTDCSVEQRAEITAAASDGVLAFKLSNALQKVYPEYIWRWDEYKNGGTPRNVDPGQAALILYSTSPEDGHYAIVMNQGGEYLLYNPQSLTIEPFHCITQHYYILNAYNGLFEGKLPPRRINYQILSSNPNPQAEQHQIYYSIMHYVMKAQTLFKDDILENDIEVLNEIGNFINKVNDMKLVVRDQKDARLVLNHIYARHYKSLLIRKPGELVAINKRLYFKNQTNFTEALARVAEYQDRAINSADEDTDELENEMSMPEVALFAIKHPISFLGIVFNEIYRYLNIVVMNFTRLRKFYI
jgi:hypothetical protein